MDNRRFIVVGIGFIGVASKEEIQLHGRSRPTQKQYKLPLCGKVALKLQLPFRIAPRAMSLSGIFVGQLERLEYE